MDNSKQIDFLSGKARINFKKIVPTIIVFIILFGIAFTTRAVISSENVSQQFGKMSVIEQIKFLVSSDDKQIKGEEKGRINVLVLGIGGENHSGGMLTDTIIIASIDKNTGKIGLISIPRDLVVPIEGVGWQKINSAHAYGASKGGEGSGIELAKKTIENITDLEIHYYFKIDFEGFKKIVDAIGGIRVDVPVSFSDYEYPDNSFGYQTISFEKGLQNMDGEKALQYARSRHGTAGQGSDFARAARQQQIIKAFQIKVAALSTILNPSKLLSVVEIIGKYMETNMQIWELYRMYEIGKTCDKENVNQVVLSTAQDGFLSQYTNEEGAYLLKPRIGFGDFSEIMLVAKNITSPQEQVKKNHLEPTQQEPNITQTEEINIDKTEEIKIAVQNGTKHSGLAAKTAASLRVYSYKITQISNAQTQNYEKTVIYKLTDKAIEEKDMQKIREVLGANISTITPDFDQIPDADILIIVGEDSV